LVPAGVYSQSSPPFFLEGAVFFFSSLCVCDRTFPSAYYFSFGCCFFSPVYPLCMSEVALPVYAHPFPVFPIPSGQPILEVLPSYVSAFLSLSPLILVFLVACSSSLYCLQFLGTQFFPLFSTPFFYPSCKLQDVPLPLAFEGAVLPPCFCLLSFLLSPPVYSSSPWFFFFLFAPPGLFRVRTRPWFFSFL